jgi:hypothetical protein
MADSIFNWSVAALIWLSNLLGISYKEINVYLFCIAWPLVTVFMMVMIVKLWRDNRRLNRLYHTKI